MEQVLFFMRRLWASSAVASALLLPGLGSGSVAASQSSATVTPLGGVVEPLTGITLPSASSDALTMVPKACVRCMLGFCRLPQSRFESCAFGGCRGLHGRLASIALINSLACVASFCACMCTAPVPVPAPVPSDRAYVYGLYLDSSALQQRSVGGVLASKAADPAASTLRMQLVVARNAEGEHWAKGFQKSIQRRLQMGDPDVDTGNHLTALVRVRGQGRALLYMLARN